MPDTNPDQSRPGPSRRTFLKSGAAVIAGTAASPTLLAGTIAAQNSAAAPVPSFELDEITLADLRNGLESGKFTARSLCEKYLARIEQVDRSGPELKAVIEINPEALQIADQLDAERRAKRVRGPLHGIPVLIKDNIATADQDANHGRVAGAGRLEAAQGRFIVAAACAPSGAVILGKTNLSEWANFRSTHSTSGWSGRGGLTRNPYALDRNPSGSSSGSGAAVAANLCAVAIGSETDGSIVSPSCNCGIVGIKPTVGLVSRTGIVPISHTQDTAGPMARTVADAAALLSAIAGLDSDDPASAAARGKIESDYTRFLDANGLKGARIGVVRKYAGFDRNVDRLFDEAIAAMKQAGAAITDPVEIATIGKFDDAENQVLQFEFKTDLNAYLAGLGQHTPVHSLTEIIAFNDKHYDQELFYFGQEIMTQSNARGPLTSPDYVKALADCRRMSRAEGIDLAMDKLNLDALIAPTGSAAWTTDLVNGDHTVGGSSSLAAVAGYPNINVPMGWIFGLPVGISFFGRAWSEGTLIRIAYAYEQATHMRKPPKFLPTADLSLHG